MSAGESFWKISVNGYGDFAFFGTEKEAEEMRIHKARWEQGVAHKRRIPKNFRIATAMVDRNAHEANAGSQSAIELRRRIANYLEASK